MTERENIQRELVITTARVTAVVAAYTVLRLVMRDGSITAQLLAAGGASEALPAALALSYVILRIVVVVLLPPYLAFKLIRWAAAFTKAAVKPVP